MLLLLKYWRIGAMVALVVAAGAFYVHYQGIKNERNTLRVENARLDDINKANDIFVQNLIKSHETAVKELTDLHTATEAETETFEEIEDDSMAQEDGPLSPNLKRLLERLRGTQDGS